MKKIYTSYYNNPHIRNLPNLFAISIGQPSYFKGKVIPALMPTWEMVNKIRRKEITETEFTTLYFSLLKTRRLDPRKIVQNLPDRSVLLCHEVSGKFCHRNLVAEWLTKNADVKINEWLSEEEYKQNKLVQSHILF